MKTLIIAFMGLLTLAGCHHAPDKLKPMPWIFDMAPKDAPNNFKVGWRDGCETGLSTYTNSLYKRFYSFRQDQKLRNDSTYYKSWKVGFTFCKMYAYGTLRETNQRIRLPNALPSAHTNFMAAEGIFEVGLLHMWGPADWLVPFQKVGAVGGDRWMPALGNGPAGSDTIGGAGTLDFTNEGFNMIGSDTGLNMDYSNIPFFGASDPPPK